MFAIANYSISRHKKCHPKMALIGLQKLLYIDSRVSCRAFSDRNPGTQDLVGKP